MAQTSEQWQIPEGTDVIGADGDKVGKVVAVESSYIVVEKGVFFPTDYYVPLVAINSFDGDTVYLTVTKDEALNQGWDQPLGGASDSGSDTTEVQAQTANHLRSGDLLTNRAPTARTPDVTATQFAETDTLRVPVHEEELTATTRPVERGQVWIEKDVIAEERTLAVPITEEHVTVTRRAVDRATGVDDMVFQEDTIEIPLRSEEVEVQKRTRVVEEIDIAKDTVQRTKQVADTVRREEVRVEDHSEVDVIDGATGTTATVQSTASQRRS